MGAMLLVRARYRVRAPEQHTAFEPPSTQPAPQYSTRPSSLAPFFSGMARFAALYFRKKRSHAPGPTTIIAGSATGMSRRAN
jgi:hypothetical protein